MCKAFQTIPTFQHLPPLFNVGNFHVSHRGLMNLLEEFLIPVPKYQMLVGCLQQYPLLREHESQEDLVDSDVLLHKGQVHS